MTDDVLGEDDGGQGVDTNEALHVRIAHDRQRPIRGRGRVVDQSIDRAEVLLEFLDQLGDIVDLCEV